MAEDMDAVNEVREWRKKMEEIMVSAKEPEERMSVPVYLIDQDERGDFVFC